MALSSIISALIKITLNILINNQKVIIKNIKEKINLLLKLNNPIVIEFIIFNI